MNTVTKNASILRTTARPELTCKELGEPLIIDRSEGMEGSGIGGDSRETGTGKGFGVGEIEEDVLGGVITGAVGGGVVGAVGGEVGGDVGAVGGGVVGAVGGEVGGGVVGAVGGEVGGDVGGVGVSVVGAVV